MNVKELTEEISRDLKKELSGYGTWSIQDVTKVVREYLLNCGHLVKPTYEIYVTMENGDKTVRVSVIPTNDVARRIMQDAHLRCDRD